MLDLFHNRVALLVLVGGVLLLLATSAEGDDQFRAGAATADLTPGEGVSLNGPISKPGPVRGVHDQLNARALVFALGETKCAIVVCDMCMIDREVYDQAKTIVMRETGIPPQHQLMAATHTHAAPRVARISTRDPDEAYRKLVAKRIADAVAAANQRLAPAKLAVTSFQRPDLVACRRSLCREGSVDVDPFGRSGAQVKSVAGRGQVIKPAGPVDPEFSIVSIQHADGAPLAVLGNLSVHYCGGYAGGMVSADYFGVYSRELEKQLASKGKSSPFVGLMSNATSGDQGSFRRGGEKTGPWQRMEHFGKLLADESIRQLKSLKHEAPRSLSISYDELTLQVRKPDAARIAWARKLLAQPDAKGPHRWSRVYAAEALHLVNYPDKKRVPLQMLHLGDLSIAAAPCEVFAETGLAIKKASPRKHTMVMELANGYGGYLPTPQQHAWGGYETWPARSSNLEVDAEPQIRARLIELLNEPTQD